MLEFVAALLVTWPIHMLPALFLAAPTYYLTRKKIAWRSTDFLGFVLPWLIWVLVFTFGPRAASLSSAIGESVLLGFLVGLGFIVFALLHKQINSSQIRLWLLTLVCTFAVLMWALFPFIGE
jgi:hypothetical protein